MRLFVTKQKEKEIVADAVDDAIGQFVVSIVGEEEYCNRLTLLLEQHPNMDSNWYDRNIINGLINKEVC